MKFFRTLTLLGAGLQGLLAITIGLAVVLLAEEETLVMLFPLALLGVLAGLSVVGLGNVRSARMARVGSIVFNGLLLFAFGVSTLAFTRHAADGAPPEDLGVLVAMLVISASCAACLAGLLGFRPPRSEADGGPSRRSPLRRVLAVSGSVLGAAVVALVAAVIVLVTFDGSQQQRTMQPPALPSRPAYLVFDEDLNYAFSTVSWPWARTPREQWGRAARLMLDRNDPDMSFMIVAEALPPGQLPTEWYAEFSLNNLRQRGMVSLLSNEVHVNDGLEWRRLVSDARIDRTDYRFVHWILVRGGFSYQLITRGPRSEAELVETEAKMLFTHFRMLDPDRIVDVSGSWIEPHVSERWGYRVEPSAPGWSIAPNKAIPASDFDAAMGTIRLMVVPVSLAGMDPRSDAMVRALLHPMDFEFPSPAITGVRLTEQEDGISAREITAARQIDSQTFVYRFRVVRGKHIAYLVAAWRYRSDPDLTDLDEAVDAVKIDAEAVPPGLEDLTDNERVAQAGFFNQLGLGAFHRHRFAQASELFQLAVELDPENPDYVQNVAITLESDGRLEEALAFLGAHGSRHEGRFGLLEIEAGLREATGDVAGAIDVYERLLATGRDEHAAGLILLLVASEQFERASKVLDEYIVPTTSSYRTLSAIIKLGQGDDEGAIAVLREELSIHPQNEEATEALFDIFYEAGRYHEAIEVCDEFLAHTPDPDVYYWRALAEIALGWYPQAKESLEHAQRIVPTDPDVGRLLRHISTELGRGDTSLARNPIDQVPLPDGVTGVAPDPDPGPGSGVAYEHHITAIQFVPGEPLRTTEYQRLRILDRRGVDQFSTFGFGFDPRNERIFVNSATVFDRDGNEVWRGQLSDYYVLDDPAGDAASQRKNLHIPIGALAPGRIVEVIVTRRKLGISEHMPFREHVFGNSFPVAQEAVVVYADPERVAFATSGDVQVTNMPDGLLFMMEGLSAIRTETRQPALRTFMPTVRLGSPERDWASLARNYLERVADRLEVTDSVRSLAKQVVAEAETDEERIALLARHVQGKLSYRAIAFGPRAYIPVNVDQTIRNAAGDCKDHALLLHLLLKAIGIESHLALVDTRGDIEAGLPSMDQFNHMIVHVPPLADDWFIDPTDKYTNVMMRAPYALGGRTALVLDADDPRLVEIPPYTMDSSTVEITRQIQVEDGGRLSIRERVEIDGYTAGWLRSTLAFVDPAEYATELQYDYGSRWPVRMLRAGAQNVFEPSQPLVIDVEYTIDGVLQEVGAQLAGSLPAPFERIYLDEDPVAERWSPFELGWPVRIISDVTVTWPEGMALTSAHSSEGWKELFIEAEATVSVEATRLVFRASANRSWGIFPAEQFEAFSTECDAALRLFEPRIVLRSPGDGS